MPSFDETRFRKRIDDALLRIRTILDNARHPQYPSDVDHHYLDKYILAEFVTNSALAGILNCLGFSEKLLAEMKNWAKTRSVSLRLTSEEHCKFIKKVVREVESDTKKVTTSIFGKRKTFTVTKVTEYMWGFSCKWSLEVFPGNDSANSVQLHGRSGSVETKTATEQTPRPSSVVNPSLDLNITWLLEHIDDKGRANFSINREHQKCKTPRRNPQVKEARSFMKKFRSWCKKVKQYFFNGLFPLESDHGLDLSAINNDAGYFDPVIPVFEECKRDDSSSSSSQPASVLPPFYLNTFLAEQTRSIHAKQAELTKVFPVTKKLITLMEAQLLSLLYHAKRVANSHRKSVDFIENMLYKQLVAAIGKDLTPVDFSNYVIFHHRKLFKPAYRPRPFCYAIRRPEHFPEGTLSIEAQLDDGSLADPISTVVCSSSARRPMFFPINASTKVAFWGERFLHGWISHQFSGDSGSNLSLVARARQFSSFILLVGRISSADQFEPKYGIIIQNKDELKIPLLLETIPTPKEFKDAIQSLSPEQQRFAKAFRGMQLESTLFGVCVIQIKPQLEKLLNLPEDGLTKEIQLSQDLLRLFIEYQVPSDLVSYDGDAMASVASKVAAVSAHVTKMNAMIANSKESDLAVARQAQQFRIAQQPVELYDDVDDDMCEEEEEEKSLDYDRDDDANWRDDGVSDRKERKSYTAVESKAKALFSKVRKSKNSRRDSAMPVASPAAPPTTTTTATTTTTQSQPAGASLQITHPQTQPQLQQTEVPTSKADDGDEEQDEETPDGMEEETVDYTTIPSAMERKFEEFDLDNALRPTIINPGNTWSKKYQKSLLGEMQAVQLETDQQGTERNKAFDLLDALTKSGALSIDHASLHVVVAATHCFPKTLMDTVVKDNINPVEKVERSSLIVASTVHQTSPVKMITPEQLERVSTYSPMLIDLPPHGSLDASSSPVDPNCNK